MAFAEAASLVAVVRLVAAHPVMAGAVILVPASARSRLLTITTTLKRSRCCRLSHLGDGLALLADGQLRLVPGFHQLHCPRETDFRIKVSGTDLESTVRGADVDFTHFLNS